ncbi:uncharacterized protein A4U43_C08F35460 [Asparagus officinalis]|nr:uncharacterized protein A4U43_C08F35460 [Asparagus officinalis]
MALSPALTAVAVSSRRSPQPRIETLQDTLPGKATRAGGANSLLIFFPLIPTAAGDDSFSRRRHRRGSAGDRSPFNPVIVLRGANDFEPDRSNNSLSNSFELFYDDGAGSGLRPLPSTMSDFLMGSGFDRPRWKSTAREDSIIRRHRKLRLSPCPRSKSPTATLARTPTVQHELPSEVRRRAGSEIDSEEESVGLTIWRLPGGGFAVGRFSGGRRPGERELPVVYTEMDGGFNSGGAGSESFRLFILKWMAGLTPVGPLEEFHGLPEGIEGGSVEDLGKFFVTCSVLDVLVLPPSRARRAAALVDPGHELSKQREGTYLAHKLSLVHVCSIHFSVRMLSGPFWFETVSKTNACRGLMTVFNRISLCRDGGDSSSPDAN